MAGRKALTRFLAYAPSHDQGGYLVLLEQDRFCVSG
jgi:hypothetical protein